MTTPMTRTTTRAVTLGDNLIHDTYPNLGRRDSGYDLVTACHTPAKSSDILNPQQVPLRITCAYCQNELAARDRLRELIDAEPTDRRAIEDRQREERKQRAKPLGPIRARWTFIKALREAGIER